MSHAKYEHLTDEELAKEVYLAIIANDDAVSDAVHDLYWEAQNKASVLWQRLRGPYCEVDGCGKQKIGGGEHFDLCADHLRERKA